jgi:hypothetical protein
METTAVRGAMTASSIRGRVVAEASSSDTKCVEGVNSDVEIRVVEPWGITQQGSL